MRKTSRIILAIVLLHGAGAAEGQSFLAANAGVFVWQMRFKQDDPHEDDLTENPGLGRSLSLHYREEPADGKIGLNAGVTWTFRECGISITSGGHATSDRTVADLRMNTMHVDLGLNIPMDSAGTVWFRPSLMTGIAAWTVGSGYDEFQGLGQQVRQSFSDRHFDEFHSGVRLSAGVGFRITFGAGLFLDLEPYFSYGLTNEYAGDANFRHDEWGVRIGSGVALPGWRNLGQLPMPRD